MRLIDLLEEGLKRSMDKLKDKERDKVSLPNALFIMLCESSYDDHLPPLLLCVNKPRDHYCHSLKQPWNIKNSSLAPFPAPLKIKQKGSSSVLFTE